MSKDEIINEIANSQWFHQACKNIGKHNADDLQQEFLLQLCSKEEEYVLSIQPYIKWWTITTLTRISHPANERKQFNKYFNPKFDELDFEIKTEHQFNYNDELEQARDNIVKKLYWFDAKLFELYESGQKYSNIARSTNIHHKTIKLSITNTICLIKKEYERITANNINVLFDDINR